MFAFIIKGSKGHFISFSNLSINPLNKGWANSFSSGGIRIESPIMRTLRSKRSLPISRTMSSSMNDPLAGDTIGGRISVRLQEAMAKTFGDGFLQVDPMITYATKLKFGDYQCNVAMSLAKSLGCLPREVALKLVGSLQLNDICEPPTIQGIR